MAMDCQQCHDIRTLSVIVEFENATTICWADIAEMLQSLSVEIKSFRDHVKVSNRHVQVIFVHPGPDSDSQVLREGIAQKAEGLFRLASVEVASLPNGRYYELKNRGISQATGDVVVFFDSDTVAEIGWLETLLAPFQNQDTVAVNGQTYLKCRDFMSRSIALFWIFPVREHDPKWGRKRGLNANNCAFRREWLTTNPFPADDGFKVSCSLLTKNLQAQGHALVQAPARAGHQPLRGWRFLVWRALVTGRDADRKYCRMKSASVVKRAVHAFSFWFKMEKRTIDRVISLHRQVAMPFWQVPAALLLGLSFYSLGFLGQTLRVFGIGPNRPEFIPEYVEYS